MAVARILIVEDQVLTAESIRQALLGCGYEVQASVTTGEEAVSLAEESQPDLVLMDVRLAGEMDGVAAAEQIHSRFDVPVIYLTAHADDETLRRARVSEPFGYILKPFRVEDLRTTVEMALYKYSIDRKLKQSEARYRAVVEDQTELICRFLPDGTLSFANSAYCRFFGLAQEGLEGRSFMSFVPVEERAAVERRLASLRPETPMSSCEAQVSVAGGEVRWLQWTSRALFDGRNQLVEYQLVGRDITARKRAEVEREKLIVDLQAALSEVKTLSGLLPICASCKKIRDDRGYWTQVEVYIRDRSDARFSHGICPDCARELYPEFYQEDQ